MTQFLQRLWMFVLLVLVQVLVLNHMHIMDMLLLRCTSIIY